MLSDAREEKNMDDWLADMRTKKLADRNILRLNSLRYEI